ncbi:MAG: 1-acyl-sn-glycerol-3-phosphate acyltransferase, partial [Lentisphaerae bacterium]|nr:1-acyl-sn-glycerol-3-phosphate acyltransferase [Lentisphaerota bacterium]
YREGVSVISFPEGTRSGGKEMGPFHSSIFRFAIQTHAIIVPICMSGNEDKPMKGSLVLHPGIVKVHRLPEIYWEDYKMLNAFQLKAKVRDEIQSELLLMDEDT